MLNSNKKRIAWLDCAKAFAMICVIEDHCSQLLYPSKIQLYGAYVSVSLFIVLSGISAWIAHGENNDVKKQLRRFGNLLLQYVIGTAVMYVATYGYFNFQSYLDCLWGFNVISAYYFFVILFELALITPVLISWCNFCTKRKIPVLWHIASLLTALMLAVVFYQKTYMFNLGGYARYFLGASGFFLYYCGILLAKSNIFEQKKIPRLITIAVGIPVWYLFLYEFTYKVIGIDANFTEYIGQGINPAGVMMCLITFTILAVLYSIFSLLDELNFMWSDIIIKIFSTIGKYTIYIYLYHILIRDSFSSYISQFTTEPFVMRITVYFPMIILPVLFGIAVKYIKKLYNKYSSESLIETKKQDL